MPNFFINILDKNNLTKLGQVNLLIEVTKRLGYVPHSFKIFIFCFQQPMGLVHTGIGPSLASVRLDLNGDLLPPNSINFIAENTNTSKTIPGGTGQIGFKYMFAHQFIFTQRLVRSIQILIKSLVIWNKVSISIQINSFEKIHENITSNYF